jgi:hypothetical protein
MIAMEIPIVLQVIVPTVVSIISVTWFLSKKLSCAKGIAEEALKQSQDAVRRVERAEDRAEQIHTKLFDKIDEIKTLISNQ